MKGLEEILFSNSVGPGAYESVVDSALLRPKLGPSETPSLYLRLYTTAATNPQVQDGSYEARQNTDIFNRIMSLNLDAGQTGTGAHLQVVVPAGPVLKLR
jgi:hypothetical protein